MKPANLIIIFNFLFAVFYPVFSLDYKNLETSHDRSISAYDLNIVVKQHNDGKQIAVEAFSGNQSIFRSTSRNQIDHDLTQYGFNILCNLDGTVQLTSAQTTQNNIIVVSDIQTKVRLQTFGKAVLKDLANSQKTIIDAPYFDVVNGNKLREVYVESKTTTTFKKGQFDNVIFGQKDGSIIIDQDAKYNVNDKENGTFYLLKGILENDSNFYNFKGDSFYSKSLLNSGKMNIHSSGSVIRTLNNKHELRLSLKDFKSVMDPENRTSR